MLPILTTSLMPSFRPTLRCAQLQATIVVALGDMSSSWWLATLLGGLSGAIAAAIALEKSEALMRTTGW
jgi:hypothetical protein